jgi:hypothetical protein
VPASKVRSRATKKTPLVLTWTVISILTACVLRPEWQRLAVDGKLESAWLDTGTFRHRWLWNEVSGSHLRIYVEGDGTPWIREDRVAIDPTPTNPVLLSLMHDTGDPAVYLGRPCYFGTATAKGCDARWWTFDRYGRTVVESMCAAANEISRQAGADTVALVGFSGGGAIVIGMRQCTDRLVSVSTIAGNLDPDAWAGYHDYAPLRDDAISGEAGATPDSVNEVHWQCRDDENIPPMITDRYFASHPQATRHIVDSCTHATGWQAYWSRIIENAAAD